MTSSISDIRQLGTILFVGAHPDDEVFCAGGLLAAAVANGQKVACIVATHGEKGIQDETRWPASGLADIRTSELNAAYKILGLKECYWLDCFDGGCKPDDQPTINKLANLAKEINPKTVITFGPDGLTGHTDHQAVSAWVSEVFDGDQQVFHVVVNREVYEKAWHQVDKLANAFFNVEHPPLVEQQDCDINLVLPPELLSKKLDALAAMPSQYDSYFSKIDKILLSQVWQNECFVRAK